MEAMFTTFRGSRYLVCGTYISVEHGVVLRVCGWSDQESIVKKFMFCKRQGKDFKYKQSLKYAAIEYY